MTFQDTCRDIFKTHDYRTVELEFRLGIQTSRGFHTNIAKLAWMTARNKLQGGVESLTVDKYVKSVRGGESSRHVSVYDSSNTVLETYWEHKKKLQTETISEGTYAVRSSLAIETKEQGPPPPNSYVLRRTKCRTSFAKGPWRLDFTRVTTIPSENTDVEETYEIEVELADVGYFFEKELDLVIQEGISLAQSLVKNVEKTYACEV